MHFIHKSLLALLLFLPASKAFSQKDEKQRGHIIVNQDSSIAVLLRRNAALNESRQTMPGFRIQIYFGTDRTKASEIRTEFIRDHPGTDSYLVYHQPNFKVRIGDYKTRLEAVKAMQLIAVFYPSAFIVKDEVKLPRLD